jgi:hypothetical protein
MEAMTQCERVRLALERKCRITFPGFERKRGHGYGVSGWWMPAQLLLRVETSWSFGGQSPRETFTSP